MPNPRRVYISGQKRGVFGVIKRELRRSAIEPVIGHMNTDGHSKTDGHLERGHLKGRDGDTVNVSSAPSATTFASSSPG